MKTFGNDNFILAGFSVRLAAYFIDIIIVNILLCIIRFPMWIIRLFNKNMILFQPLLFDFNIYDIFLYIVSVFYFIIMLYYGGATIGKKLMKIKVVSTNGNKLTFLNIIYRETIGKYLSSIFFIGYIMIICDKYKKGLHDILCDTQVIYNKEQFALIPVAVSFPIANENFEVSEPDEKEDLV